MELELITRLTDQGQVVNYLETADDRLKRLGNTAAANAAKTQTSMKSMGISSGEAARAVTHLASEMGVALPSGAGRMLSSLSAIGPAMATAFSPAAIMVLGGALMAGLPYLVRWLQGTKETAEETKKLREEQEKLNKELKEYEGFLDRMDELRQEGKTIGLSGSARTSSDLAYLQRQVDIAKDAYSALLGSQNQLYLLMSGIDPKTGESIGRASAKALKAAADWAELDKRVQEKNQEYLELKQQLENKSLETNRDITKEIEKRDREVESTLKRYLETKNQIDRAMGVGTADIGWQIGAAQYENLGKAARLDPMRTLTNSAKIWVDKELEVIKVGEDLAKQNDALAQQVKLHGKSFLQIQEIKLAALDAEKLKYSDNAYALEQIDKQKALVIIDTNQKIADEAERQFEKTASTIENFFDRVFLTARSASDVLKQLWTQTVSYVIKEASKIGVALLQSLKGGSATGAGGVSLGTGVMAGLTGLLPGAAVMGSTAAAQSSNPYLQGLGVTGLGLAGMAGVGSAVMGTSLSTALMSAFWNPWSAAAAGTVLGGIALAKAIKGKNAWSAGAPEAMRDFGLNISKDTFQQFAGSVGLSESQSYGIRKDLQSSPLFLQQMAAQGQIADLNKLKNVTTVFGTFDFSQNYQKGLNTGDWGDLNRQWVEAFKNSGALVSIMPDFADKLTVVDSATSKLDATTQAQVDSIEALIEAFNDLITPSKTVYETFLETGEILPTLMQQFTDLGADISVLQKAAGFSGMQESLSFIQELKAGLESLIEEGSAAEKILAGTIDESAIAAMTAAGIDPEKLQAIAPLLKAMASWDTEVSDFLAGGKLVSGGAMEAGLGAYGGSAGLKALDLYGQGYNTITKSLLTSTKAAMDLAYKDQIKDVIGYLTEKEDAMTTAISDASASIVAELQKIYTALTTGQTIVTVAGSSDWNEEDIPEEDIPEDPYNPGQDLPAAALGGYVRRSGVAVIHRGETIVPAGSGGPAIYIQNCYGFDDFRRKVNEVLKLNPRLAT